MEKNRITRRDGVVRKRTSRNGVVRNGIKTELCAAMALCSTELGFGIAEPRLALHQSLALMGSWNSIASLSKLDLKSIKTSEEKFKIIQTWIEICFLTDLFEVKTSRELPEELMANIKWRPSLTPTGQTAR